MVYCRRTKFNYFNQIYICLYRQIVQVILKYNKIIILGPPGAGKTTMGKKLSRELGISLISLDMYFWQPNYKEPDLKEWQELNERIVLRDSWIIEGTYMKVIDPRINNCNLILYVNTPLFKCLFRAIFRTIKYYGRAREGMPSYCKERFNIGYYLKILSFDIRIGKRLKNRIISSDKRFIILNEETQLNILINSLK